MKNVIKLLSIMLIAGTVMVSCTEKPNEGNTPDTPVTYTVQVNSNNAILGTATISPLKSTYNSGDTVILTATPADGAKFLNWNGSITDNPYTYVVKENSVFTANFEALPQATYAATFNGTALDIAGWHDAQTSDQQGTQVWLFQAAKRAEGQDVYFPYLVMWMAGNTTSDFQLARGTELYKDTYYTAGQDYGDWQVYSVDNINCTLLDLTALTLSMTTSLTMYDLGPIAHEEVEDPADCPKATLAVTMENMNFYVPQPGKGFTKMSIVK